MSSRTLRLWFVSASLAVAITPLLTFLVFGEGEEEKPPVELQHLGFLRDKKWNVHEFRMKLSNRSDKPLWLLLPASADEGPPRKSVFRNIPGQSPTIDTDAPPSKVGFDAEGGLKVVGVGYYGFWAVRLPARTTVEIPLFNLSSRSNVNTQLSQIAFDEAEELLVNGTIPLEEWLPFEVGVFKKKELASGCSEKVKPDADKASVGEDVHPPKKVELIEAKGMRHWIIKFQNKGERGLARSVTE